jgi:hypothetical protein
MKNIAVSAHQAKLKRARQAPQGRAWAACAVLAFGKRTPKFLFMTAIKPHLQTDLTVTHVLAELLERLERSAEPVDAEQYLSVVQHLVNELGGVEPGLALGALLDTHPAAAELYENVNYQHAGLCRSALDASLDAERQAKQAIHLAMSRAP